MKTVDWGDIANERINDPKLRESPFVCNMTEDILILLDKLDAYRLDPTEVRMHQLDDWIAAMRNKYTLQYPHVDTDLAEVSKQSSYRNLTGVVESLSVTLQLITDELMTTPVNTGKFEGLMYESKEVSTLITNTLSNRSILKTKED